MLGWMQGAGLLPALLGIDQHLGSYNTSWTTSCKKNFYYIFYVNDLVLPEKWL